MKERQGEDRIAKRKSPRHRLFRIVLVVVLIEAEVRVITPCKIFREQRREDAKNPIGEPRAKLGPRATIPKLPLGRARIDALGGGGYVRRNGPFRVEIELEGGRLGQGAGPRD